MEKNKFECEECKKSFDGKSALEQHNKDKHISKQPATKSESKKGYIITIIIILSILILGYVILTYSSTNKFLGKVASNFTLPSLDGNRTSLSDYYNKKNVLLFFHEGVGCDPCWQQIKDMQKNINRFNDLNVEILSITIDPLRAQAQEISGMGITLPILSDEDLNVSKTYDVLKYSMHPGVRPGHTFILVDKKGIIRWRQDWSSGVMYFQVDDIISSMKQSL